MTAPINEAVITMAITDSTLAKAGTIGTFSGAATAVGAWLVSSTGAAVIGILGVVIGLIFQWYFKSKEDRRRQEDHLMKREIHIARLAQIRGGDLKASASEIVEDLKKTELHVPEVSVEESVSKVLDIKI